MIESRDIHVSWSHSVTGGEGKFVTVFVRDEPAIRSLRVDAIADLCDMLTKFVPVEDRPTR